MNKIIVITVVLLLIIGVGYVLFQGESTPRENGVVSDPQKQDGEDQNSSTTKQAEQVEFETVERGATSGGSMTEAVSMVIHTQEEWETAYEPIAEREVPEAELPEVDFETSTVILVSQDQTPSGGYGIEITDVTREEDGGISVSVEETEPGPACITTAIITEPYHIIKLPKISSDTEVTFEREVVTEDC